MRRAAHTVAVLLVLAACGGTDDVATDDGGAERDGTTVATTEERPTGSGDAPPDVDAAAGPEWSGPPDGEIGVVVPFDPVLAEGGAAVVAVTGATVHRTGAVLDVAVRVHPDAVDRAPEGDPMGGIGPGGPTGDERLRLEVEYPDGSTASTADGRADATGEPDAPVLHPREFRGRPGSSDHELWLWPLPEAGDEPLTLRADWPDLGLEGAQVAEVDPRRLTSAADRVVQVWPDEG